ncbi:GlsB/YeaQ/YmgE family stress response membrane protein [candidate division BRC1 bacterium HGW-BRC1-1]|jgi:uncharacterized membrane protein YeaQ/YmgE (transglycosylase-associated protein family)|nr:MAG: GlsB/YeaQ/YmgE family stress response membrane protein [candidate division BRC1 bacterium HGW-BRC1-1]
MGLISTFIFGLVAGIVAKMLMPGRDPGGFIITAIIGIVGAFIGKYISELVGGTENLMRWTWPGFFYSVLGAIVLLFLYRMIRGRNA